MTKVIQDIAAEYRIALHSKEINEEALEEGIRWLYEELLQNSKPEIVYGNSPKLQSGIRKKAKKPNRLAVKNALGRYLAHLAETQGIRMDNLHVSSVLLENLHLRHDEAIQEIVMKHGKNGINLKNELQRLAYIDFFLQSGKTSFPEFASLKKLYCSGAYHVFFWDNVVYALASPLVRQDEQLQLHALVYPAIEWPAGPKAYYIHGRETPEWVFTRYGTESLYRRFLKEENEDLRASIITLVKARESDHGLLKFLKAKLVDEQEIIHFSGYKELLRLYKSREKFEYLYDRHGKSGQPYCWSEFTCPSTGATYLIDNSADFTDAVEAAKFLRPDFVPKKAAYKWSHDAS